MMIFLMVSFWLVFFMLVAAMPYCERRRRYHDEQMRMTTEKLRGF